MTMLLLRVRSSYRWLRRELWPAMRLLDLTRRGNVLVTATPSMESFAPTHGAAILNRGRLCERPRSARRCDVTMTAFASARRGDVRRRGRDEAWTCWSHPVASAVLRRSDRSRKTGRRNARGSRRFSLGPARSRQLATCLCRADYHRTAALRAEEALPLR